MKTFTKRIHKWLTIPSACLATLVMFQHCPGQPLGLLEGTVKDRLTQEALIGVNVLVLDTPWGAATSHTGQFQIWLPQGAYRLRLQMVGYQDLTLGPFNLEEGRVVNVIAEMEEKAIPLDEVVVMGERKSSLERNQLSAHCLERRQMEGLSGTVEDVLRTIQTLPGVVSPADFLGRVYVRGGKSSENVVILDRIFIYEPYHLGGAMSIFNPELIDHVEFHAGGFPAQYGQALSSIMRVYNKTGLERSFQGEVSLSVISANAVLQGKLPGDNGTWVVSTRRSYHDKLMEAVGAFKNYIFPHFHDFQLKATLPIHQHHIFTMDMLSSGDALKVKLENPDNRVDALADSGNLAWDNQLTLASLDWKWLITTKSYSHLTMAYSRQPFDSEVSGFHPQWFNGQVHNVDLNADLAVLSVRGHELEAGWYLRGSDAHLDINLKQDYFLHSSENSNVALDTTMLLSSIDKNFYYAGLYIQDEWEVVPPLLRVGYGLRCESMNTSPAIPISPRFYLIHRFTEDTRVKFSWGHFYQFSIDPTQVEPPLGSNQLKPKKAIHYILGCEHEPTENSKIRIEGYIKELSHLFVFSPQMKFANYGRGEVQGLEFFYERRPSGLLDGWASYSYSVARRRDLAGTPAYHPLQDQTHTASLVVNYHPNPRWRLSWKWMAHSGRPYTPVMGAKALVDSTTGEVTGYLPIEGSINSKRFPSYQRLDMRLDREFQFDGWDMNIYLEVLNVYDHKNVYDYSYTKDYSRRITTYQFPLLPSLGIKVMF